MTIRSAMLGFVLALGVSLFTYFNDHIIRQTFFVGNHLPLSVFGLLVLIIIGINPLLHKIAPRFKLATREIVIIAAIVLSSLGWGGTSFFRHFGTVVALPGSQYKSRANWNASRVLSYVPGGSPLLAQGHIANWQDLSRILQNERSGYRGAVAGRLWDGLEMQPRELVAACASGTTLKSQEKTMVIDALNDELIDSTFFSSINVSIPDQIKSGMQDALAVSRAGPDRSARGNRFILEQCFGPVIIKSTPGNGILLENGDGDTPASVSIVQGSAAYGGFALWKLPWRAWMPTILFWGGLALALSLAVFSMVLITQPQWKRELLPYPIAGFLLDLLEQVPNRAFPKIAQSSLFWYGFALMFFIHLINGLHAWIPSFIMVPLTFDFSAIGTLAPVYFSQVSLTFTLIPTLIAFTFFLNADISLSVGVSGLVYAFLFTVLNGAGIAVNNNFSNPENMPMFRFGAYVGIGLMMLFIGRGYYLSVIAGAMGLRRSSETPVIASVAVWGVVAGGSIFTVVLAQNGLDWQLGLAVFALVMLTFLVMSRIAAETGLFFNQSIWLPAAAILMLMGIPSLGPTAYFVMFIVSIMFTADVRECVMTFVSHGMYIASDATRGLPAARVVGAIAVVMFVGFAAPLVSTLYLQNVHGLNHADDWAAKNLPPRSMDQIDINVSKLEVFDELASSLQFKGIERFRNIRPDWPIVGWAVAGLMAVILFGMLRIRFSWWPFHPLIFLLVGTWFAQQYFVASVLLGWLCKVSVVKFSGATGYHHVKPFMVGVIAGELVAGLLWIGVGVAYYFATGLVPTSYAIFPG